MTFRRVFWIKMQPLGIVVVIKITFHDTFPDDKSGRAFRLPVHAQTPSAGFVWRPSRWLWAAGKLA
jgi:hypothetical protein